MTIFHGLAFGADEFPRQDIQTASAGDGQWPPKQRVDETEGSNTGPDAESKRKHGGSGDNLVSPELPPSEAEVIQNGLEPFSCADAVASLYRNQPGAECTARFAGVTSSRHGFVDMRLQLFLNLAVQTFTSSSIRHTRP